MTDVLFSDSGSEFLPALHGSMVILERLESGTITRCHTWCFPAERETITVEIAGFASAVYGKMDIVFAGTIISIVPALIIFCLFQLFRCGITAGAAKGNEVTSSLKLAFSFADLISKWVLTVFSFSCRCQRA